MFKSFKKAISIFVLAVFVLSLLPFGAMAEVGTRTTASIAFSNVDRIDYGYTRNGSGYYEQWNHRPATCYMRSAYPTFVQIDLAGYEEVLKNENTKVYMNLIQASGSYPLTGTVDVYLAADNCDQLSFSDATTFNHNIAVSSGFFNKQRPLFFNIASAASTCSSGELAADTLLAVLDENYENSKIALYMQGSAKGSLKNTTSFNIVYDENEIDNQDYVNGLADKLTWNVISDEPQNDVGNNLNLPKKFYGADVKWTSDNEDVISSSGEVTVNPNANVNVTLTAELTYTNFKGDYAKADIEPIVVKVTKPKYDYSTGAGTYYDGNIGFKAHSGSNATHYPVITTHGGIAGKTEDDLCYKLQDATGNRRYELAVELNDNEKRDVIEFNVYVPSDGYGLQVTGNDDSGSEYDAIWNFKNDGIYLARHNDGRGRKIVSYDGQKWHHIAIMAPGIINSDASGIEYDTTVKFYVDGVLEYTLDVSSSNPTPRNGFTKCVVNGLCPVTDYTEDSVWDTVACYFDNFRWTNDPYVADYHTLSSVASDKYGIDAKGETLTVIGEGTTVETIINSLTIDEDANARMYDSEWNLIDDTEEVNDSYMLVVVDTNGTTSERSYAYYEIRVLGNGEYAFDAPYITVEDGEAIGTVKLFNYSGEPKAYKVYLAIYNDGELVGLDVSKVDLTAADKTTVTFETNKAAFASGNTAKLFVWEENGITPELLATVK